MVSKKIVKSAKVSKIVTDKRFPLKISLKQSLQVNQKEEMLKYATRVQKLDLR
jgi:hypothetical protein